MYAFTLHVNVTLQLMKQLVLSLVFRCASPLLSDFFNRFSMEEFRVPKTLKCSYSLRVFFEEVQLCLFLLHGCKHVFNGYNSKIPNYLHEALTLKEQQYLLDRLQQMCQGLLGLLAQYSSRPSSVLWSSQAYGC